VFLEVRILNELCGHFLEVRIVKGLGDGRRLLVGRGQREWTRRNETRILRRNEVTIGRELCGLVECNGGAFLFPPPLIRRNNMIIHRTRMQSRELFYLIVIRMARDRDYSAAHAPGAESKGVRIWLTESEAKKEPTLAKTARMGHPPTSPRRSYFPFSINSFRCFAHASARDCCPREA